MNNRPLNMVPGIPYVFIVLCIFEGEISNLKGTYDDHNMVKYGSLN